MIKYKTESNLVVWKLDLPVYVLEGTIIDIETDGSNEIIVFGYISENSLVSVLRTIQTDYNLFLRQIYKKLKILRKPFYGYNTDFEKKFLGYNDIWIDLMSIHKRLSKMNNVKFPKLKEVSPAAYLNYYNLSNLDISNKEVPNYWKNYILSKDESILEAIIRHNVIDLLSELNLLLANKFLSWELKL